MPAKNDPKITRVANRAMECVDKYRNNAPARFKYLYGIELRQFQWEWFYLMDIHPDVLGYACMRVGKTYVVSLKNMDDMVCNDHDECLIFAPREDQAINAYKYMYDVFADESKLPAAMVSKTATGKTALMNKSVNLVNNSSAKCFGVGSQFESENGSIIHIDEYDDIPDDRLTRITGRGLAANKNGLPTRTRITGVIWGKLNIWRYIQNKEGFVLPPVNVYQAMQGGLLDERMVHKMRLQMTDDDWLRTMCLQFEESRNFIWSLWRRMSMMIGLKWNLTPIPPLPGSQFKKTGRVACALDMGAQGSGDDASDYAINFMEEVAVNGLLVRRWLWGRTWPSTTEPDTIIKDTVDYWRFYSPDYAFGDARDANLITNLNEELYSEGLVNFDWKLLGENSQAGWGKWFENGLMAPLHNTSSAKSAMYTALRNAFNNVVSVGRDPVGCIIVLPYLQRDMIDKSQSYKELNELDMELGNLISEITAAGHLKVLRYKKKISDNSSGLSKNARKLGDDRADSLAMCNWALESSRAKHGGGFVGMVKVRGV